MKRLLLFLTLTFSFLSLAIGQVPANDLFQNATLINQAPFNDFNLRLDLASASNGGQINCNLNGLQTVYYKFTAESTGLVTVTLTDASNLAIGQSYAIIYSAPNLNITDENQLTLFSNCSFGDSTTINVSQGTSYYILVHRINGDTNFTNVSITIPLEVPQSERDALVDFYNVTNGPNWINNTNWNTANPVSSWHGLTVEKINNVNHVTGISFNNNNVSPNIPGSIQNLTELKEFFVIGINTQYNNGQNIPPEIGNLSNLTTLYFENWDLEGNLPNNLGSLTNLETLVIRGTDSQGPIPSTIVNLTNCFAMSFNDNLLSGNVPDVSMLTNLDFFRIQDNFFEFGDFENEFATYQANIPGFTYSPQEALLDSETETTLNIGDGYQMNAVSVSGSSNLFQWYKDGVILNGETNNYLQLTNFQVSQSGSYHCEVASTIVTGLFITAGTFIVGLNPTSHPDYDALVEIYNSTNGDNWTNNTNWLDVNQPISTWYGITEANGRVSQISLSYNNLSGSIPESIGNLDELIYLDLQVNNLTGGIPNSIGNLSQLFYLRLNTNQLTGTIPIELYTVTNLQYLILSVNNLTGPIAPEIGNLTNLFQLQIGDNNFGGTVPSEIGNLGNLGYLDLRACSLSGSIPTEIGNLTNLTSLFLFLNNLSGSIPNSLQNLVNLQNLQLSNNLLTGNIPDFTGIVNLAYLNFSNNYFQFGDFEAEFNQYQSNTIEFIYSPQLSPSSVANTITLQIGDNSTLNSEPISGTNNLYQWYLNGQLIAGATNLDYDINNFQLNESGTYECLVSNSVVVGLEISAGVFEVNVNTASHPDYDALVAIYNTTNGNNWTNNTNWLDVNQPISSWYGITLVNGRVTVVNLQENNLDGIISPEIANLTELKLLAMANNNLSGNIPAEFENLTNLEYINFSASNLSGELPIELGNLPSLKQLYLMENNFTGTFPLQLTNISTLEDLGLRNNDFSGEIPTEIANLSNLITLRLQGNNFTGNIPVELASMPNIQNLLFWENKLSGELPDFSSSTTLNLFWVDRNNFDFTDLETNFSANSSFSSFIYSPQYTLDEAINIEAVPGTDITLNVNDTNVGRNSSTNAMANVYQWFKDDVAISGANGNSHTLNNAQISDSGIYHCEITNSILASLIVKRRDITLLIDPSLSIEDAVINTFKVYPNPTKDIVTIKLHKAMDVTANLYDITGRKILTKHTENETFKINLGTLPNGVYLLSLKTDNAIITKRIIKQ